MKKKIIMSMLSSILLLSACGGSEAQSQPIESESLAVIAESSVEASVEETIESNAESKMESLGEDEFKGIEENGFFVIESCITTSKNLIVPDTINGIPVGKIAADAFYGLGCESITLPDTITYIGENAFFSCANLEQIELGKGLKSVGKFAFADCPKLKRIEFWEGLETIENPLFVDNDELEDVIIPASVVNLPKRIASTTTCPKIVIVTPAGSEAEKVALAQGLTVRNPGGRS